MLEETRLFFDGDPGRRSQHVCEFLDADFTFVNERLARHYGIPGIKGDRFRRVSLAGTPAGGVLTQASVLAVTSNPTRTSPVKRGKWILENILGAPPAPPPSGVEALKEGRRSGALDGTLRQQMERHRTTPLVRRATGAWIPSASAWRTSTPSAPGDRTTAASRSTPRVSCRAAGRSRGQPS